MKVLKHNPDEGCEGCPFGSDDGHYCLGDDRYARKVDPDDPAPDWCPLRPENGGGVQVLAETGEKES